MERRDFLGFFGGLIIMSANDLSTAVGALAGEKVRMPALFIGHGSPMNAIEDNIYSKGWRDMARQLPKPRAILSVSAHWQTSGTFVTAMPKPKTIHDFYGFPQELFDVRYNAPGSPEFAEKTQGTVKSTTVGLDLDHWGLDHGTWSVLRKMYPNADIPVFQLSMDFRKSPAEHFAIGEELRTLRDEGVLILGSGNIVHNLPKMRGDGKKFDWAVEFDEKAASLIEKNDSRSLIEYDKLGTAAHEAIPTNEHYLPLLYTLGAAGKKPEPHFFNEGIEMGSVSMRSVWFGG